MQTYGRRGFLEVTAAVATATLTRQGFAAVEMPNRPFRLGLLVSVKDNPEEVMEHVHSLGLPTVHLAMREFSDSMAPRLRRALDQYEIEATVFISGGPGSDKYDLVDGPITNSLVPSQLRRERIDHLKKASDFAKLAGIPALFNQWGFIPEVPSDPLYEPTVEAVREIAKHCHGNGQTFFNETGQETPITLLRTLQDVGADNLAVCLDAANLVLYGKGNPVDALDVLGKYVRAVHAKGGFYPTDPRYLGKQVPAHEPNKVDWPLLIQRLKELRYDGTITIEPVAPAAARDQNIRDDKAYLEKLIAAA